MTQGRCHCSAWGQGPWPCSPGYWWPHKVPLLPFPSSDLGPPTQCPCEGSVVARGAPHDQEDNCTPGSAQVHDCQPGHTPDTLGLSFPICPAPPTGSRKEIKTLMAAVAADTWETQLGFSHPSDHSWHILVCLLMSQAWGKGLVLLQGGGRRYAPLAMSLATGIPGTAASTPRLCLHALEQ